MFVYYLQTMDYFTTFTRNILSGTDISWNSNKKKFKTFQMWHCKIIFESSFFHRTETMSSRIVFFIDMNTASASIIINVIVAMISTKNVQRINLLLQNVLKLNYNNGCCGRWVIKRCGKFASKTSLFTSIVSQFGNLRPKIN